MVNREAYEQLKTLCDRHGASLAAVSKTHPVEAIHELYNLGHRDFGENRVQELAEKAPQLPPDIRWHLIGHLQRNKVKQIAPFVHLIHSVDSLRLLEEIDKRAAQQKRVQDCLLQVFIAEEDTKFGLDHTELEGLLSSKSFREMQHVRIRGLMGMATFTEDTVQIAREFKGLAGLFRQVKTQHFGGKESFDTLSMGMTSDYTIALACGSTMLRVGSAIFGERG
jgi:PLP dependent protein